MFNKKILLIFLFAFLIRLIALNQSLWLDEAITASVVKNFIFFQIISKFSPTDFHPPLYYLFMKLWTNLFGYSEIALRMPSVIFSLLTGYVIYRISKLLVPRSLGEVGWSAIFFLFNPLIIYYSQEARMYMMATFFLTAALYFFIRLCHTEFISGSRNRFGMTKIKSLVLLNLFFTLAFFTFYGSALLNGTVILYFFIKKDYKIFILNTLYFILISLLISPLLYQQLINSKIALNQVGNWVAVLGKANIKNLLLIPIKFSIGRISFYPKWLYWGIAGGWTGFIIYQILKSKNLVYLLAYLLIFPLFLGFLVSFFTPMLQYFRFLYLIPIMSLLLGFSLSGRPAYNRGGYALVGGFLIFSLAYLLLPQFHREDWKGLVVNLPKDQPVYMITASSEPVLYYSKNSIRVNELTLLRPQGYGGQASLPKQITVIPFSAGVYGLDYKKLLSKAGYKLKKEVSFREVTYEQWEVFYTP